MTFGKLSISLRASSSRDRSFCGDADFSAEGRLKSRRLRREVTSTVSNKPELARRFEASSCRPTPSESWRPRRTRSPQPARGHLAQVAESEFAEVASFHDCTASL